MRGGLTVKKTVKVKRKPLSGARGTWLRKPQTQVLPNAKAYKRKGRTKKNDPIY